MNQLDAGALASSARLDRPGLPALQASAGPTPKARQTKDLESKAQSSGAVAKARIPPSSPFPEREPWSVASGYGPRSLDRAFKANLAKLTFGLSPAVMAEQTFDWMVHFAFSPGKQLELAEKSIRKSVRLCLYATESFVRPDIPPCVSPLPNDRRFAGEAWQRWPYNVIYQSFLLSQQLWHSATTGVDGVAQRNERSLSFTTRQVLDVFSPSNFILTNPELLEVTTTQGGRNLVRGFQNLMEDCQRTIAGAPPVGAEQFVVGQNVATTPGKVVYQNHLFELIQYAPSTNQVYSEPVLIVPSWILKYYILDLSRDNSLVKYLVDQGHTVFMISWRNPTSEDRELGMEDYREQGVMAALDAISEICPGRKVHVAGYCLGGTMLLIAAATMARDGDDRLASMTLLAAQGDFTEAGELLLFINESQISYLENMMWDRGYLETYEMSGAFQILRSNDLVWSRNLHEYLLGGRQPMNDLMAWNADTTRLPYRMHSEYLRQLFLNNDLAEGRYRVDDRPISVADIQVPSFAVGTVADHVAPWHSVYKVNLVLPDELTFVLTSGGHNAGIVSEPGHRGRTYQIRLRNRGDRYVDPDTWQAETPVQQGSWWPEWHAWLDRHSSGRASPPPMGAPEKGYQALRDAPGLYVRQP
jgi:polyhydroxyalkanoate synthase